MESGWTRCDWAIALRLGGATISTQMTVCKVCRQENVLDAEDDARCRPEEGAVRRSRMHSNSYLVWAMGDLLA